MGGSGRSGGTWPKHVVTTAVAAFVASNPATRKARDTSVAVAGFRVAGFGEKP